MALNILKFFLPKDDLFYSLFESASVNAEKISGKLLELVHENDHTKRAGIIKEMKDIEHENDNVTHQVFMELGHNFITPFDREDIHSLALALDDVCDYVYDAAKKIMLYNIDPSDQGIQKLAIAIQEGVLAVKEAVKEVRNLKNTKKIMECVIKINSAENKADDVFDLSIEKLFETESDAKQLIKMREIFQTMEEATDRCEDVGNVIESIVVKYA